MARTSAVGIFNTSGEPQGARFLAGPGITAQDNPAISFNGTDYLVVWRWTGTRQAETTSTRRE